MQSCDGPCAVALRWQVENNGLMKFYEKPNIRGTYTNTSKSVWMKNFLSAAMLLVGLRPKMYLKITHIQ